MEKKLFTQIGRRAFLQNGTLLLTAAATTNIPQLFAEESRTGVRVGLVTDLHFANKAPAGTRHYRESIAKLTEASQLFEKQRTDFVVELGDLSDAPLPHSLAVANGLPSCPKMVEIIALRNDLPIRSQQFTSLNHWSDLHGKEQTGRHHEIELHCSLTLCSRFDIEEGEGEHQLSHT